MDTLNQAKHNFELAEFQTIMHFPYKAPDLEEIKQIEEMIKNLKPNSPIKTKGILEELLNKAKGHEEYLYGFKVFKDLEGVSKDKCPFLEVCFQEGLYDLNYLARNIEDENHKLSNSGFCEIGYIEDMKEELLRLLNKHKEKIGLVGRTKFHSASFIRLRPQYVLISKGENFREIYNDFIKSMNNLGYTGCSFKEI